MVAPLLKILIVGMNYAPEQTGVAPYTTGLAQGLQEAGCSVRVLTTHPHYPAWRRSPGSKGWRLRESVNGVEIERLAHYIPRVPSLARRALSEISFGLRVLSSRWGSADVVVLVSPALLTAAIALSRSRIFHRRTPVVTWIQDLYSLGIGETRQGGRFARKLLQFVESGVVGNSDGVVVIHERFAATAAEDLSAAPERVHVVRNWTHLQPSVTGDLQEIRREVGWQPDEFVVLHAGNMGVKQGLQNIVQAAAIANRKGLNFRFVFLGAGSEEAGLRDSAANLPNIQFLSPVPEAKFTSLLRAADVLLVNEMPGVSEMAVPSKLTSYFDAGRVVVAATDISGITAEEIRSAEAGLVVEAGNPPALLRALCQLNSDPDLRNTCGDSALVYRQQVLGKDSAISKFRRILEDLHSREATYSNNEEEQ